MLKRQLLLAADRLRALRYAKPRDWERRTFSQKVQWRCGHPDPKVDYASWVDKYRAKALVAGLFPVAQTYAIVRDPEEIDALALPPTFVMKATHGSGMSLLIENEIVRGGNRKATGTGRTSNPAYLRQVATRWMKSNQHKRRSKSERHYRQVDFGVVFEAYVQPVDYEVQLFLFAGRFRLALVLFRPFVFKNVAHQIYDEDWTLREASAAQFGASLSAGIEVARPPASLFEALERLCPPSTTCAPTSS